MIRTTHRPLLTTPGHRRAQTPLEAAMLGVFLSLGATAAAAAPGYLIITGGSTTPEGGAEALAALRAAKLGPIELGKAEPVQLKSADVEGLNPGFHIAVLGGCPKKADAERVRDVARLALPGTYVREVKALPASVGCPVVHLRKGARGKVKGSVAARAQAPGLSVVALERGGPCKAALLQLKRGNEVYAETLLEGAACQRGGQTEQFEVREVVSHLDRGFVVVEHVEAWGDNASWSYALWTFSCGVWTRLGEVAPPPNAQGDVQLDAAEGRVHLTVMMSDTPFDTATFALDAQGCGFVREKPAAP